LRRLSGRRFHALQLRPSAPAARPFRTAKGMGAPKVNARLLTPRPPPRPFACIPERSEGTPGHQLPLRPRTPCRGREVASGGRGRRSRPLPPSTSSPLSARMESEKDEPGRGEGARGRGLGCRGKGRWVSEEAGGEARPGRRRIHALQLRPSAPAAIRCPCHPHRRAACAQGFVQGANLATKEGYRPLNAAKRS
jgi:hypothetical protein